MWRGLHDFPFNVSVVRNVERVTVTSKQYYHFLRARTESETAAYRPGMYEKREEEHGWMVNLYKEWKVGGPESMEMIARRYMERFVGCVENITNPKCEMTAKEKKKEIKKMRTRLDGKLIQRMESWRSGKYGDDCKTLYGTFCRMCRKYYKSKM